MDAHLLTPAILKINFKSQFNFKAINFSFQPISPVVSVSKRVFHLGGGENRQPFKGQQQVSKSNVTHQVRALKT
jgi:hypothetical protein